MQRTFLFIVPFLVLLLLLGGCDTSRPPDGYHTTHGGAWTFLPDTTPPLSSFTEYVTITITPLPDDRDAWEVELGPCTHFMRRSSEEATTSDGVLMDLYGAVNCTYSTTTGGEVELIRLSHDVEWQPDYFYARIVGTMTLREPDGTLVAAGPYEAVYASR